MLSCVGHQQPAEDVDADDRVYPLFRQDPAQGGFRLGEEKFREFQRVLLLPAVAPAVQLRQVPVDEGMGPADGGGNPLRDQGQGVHLHAKMSLPDEFFRQGRRDGIVTFPGVAAQN